MSSFDVRANFARGGDIAARKYMIWLQLRKAGWLAPLRAAKSGCPTRCPLEH